MKIIKKFFENEVLSYLFFGGLTTLVFLIIKMISFNILNSGFWSEIVAQAVAIIFAFITNKIWVFNKHESAKSIWKEFVQFVSGRLVVMAICSFANWFFIDKNPQILMNGLGVSKTTAVSLLTIVLQFLTIVVNYVISKFFVFRKK